MDYVLLFGGTGGVLFGACIAADWRGSATWLRNYTYRYGSRRPAFLRGNYDAPVIAYRLIGGFFVLVGALLVLRELSRTL